MQQSLRGDVVGLSKEMAVPGQTLLSKTGKRHHVCASLDIVYAAAMFGYDGAETLKSGRNSNFFAI